MTAEARVKELEARCESYQGLQFNYEMAKAELTAAQQDAQRLRERLNVIADKWEAFSVSDDIREALSTPPAKSMEEKSND